MLVIFLGCGGGEEETPSDTLAPKVASCSVAEGSEIPGNTDITVTFNEVMKDATIAVSGATGTSTLDASGKSATWKVTGSIPAGAHTITISGSDKAGNKLDAAGATVNFKATAPDTTAPDIVGASCDPKAGATGVDPGKVSAIKIVFSEAMGEAKVDAFEPTDAKFDQKLSDDGTTLTLSFLGGYKLSNEVTVKVTLSGADKAKNKLKTTSYTFATMKKEG